MLSPTGLSSSAFSTRYLMGHNANVATVSSANILRRRPKNEYLCGFQNIKERGVHMLGIVPSDILFTV